MADAPRCTCRVCGRPLRDPASIAVRAGRVCVLRADQVPLDFDEREQLLALGVAPAGVAPAICARANARRRGWAGDPTCETCEITGACGLHSPPPSGVHAARRGAS